MEQYLENAEGKFFPTQNSVSSKLKVEIRIFSDMSSFREYRLPYPFSRIGISFMKTRKLPEE